MNTTGQQAEAQRGRERERECTVPSSMTSAHNKDGLFSLSLRRSLFLKLNSTQTLCRFKLTYASLFQSLFLSAVISLDCVEFIQSSYFVLFPPLTVMKHS